LTTIASYLVATKARSEDQQEILPLTSVRFIAAAMVVMCHINKYGILPIAAIDDVPLEDGVSFFFVLSGFILTYTYFARDFVGKNLQRFYASRLARIWPAHFAAGILALIVAPSLISFVKPVQTGLILFTNLFMLQSWIPRPDFYFSLNSPSWSISTEFFFYLCFPFLLPAIKRSWVRPLLLTLGAAAIFVTIASVLGARGFTVRNYVLCLWLVYINPVARIFEFVIGMVTAKAFFTFKDKLQKFTPQQTTACEFASIALIAITFAISFNYCKIITGVMPSFLGSWIRYSGSSPAFALLIGSLAIGNGTLGKMFNNKIWVHLGKISYSVFLLHTVVFFAYQAHYSSLQNLPIALRISGFIAVLLVLSDLCFRFIETPCRDLLKNYLQDLPMPLRAPQPKLAIADAQQFSNAAKQSAELEKIR